MLGRSPASNSGAGGRELRREREIRKRGVLECAYAFTRRSACPKNSEVIGPSSRSLPLETKPLSTSSASRHGYGHWALSAESQAHLEVPLAPSPMSPSNLLQTLRDLDRTSARFHNQLIDLLRGNEYRDVIPTLEGEDLAWLVDYLDDVSLHNVSPHPTLTADTGPLRNLRS